jgi:acyl-CoA thioester hydrolase
MEPRNPAGSKSDGPYNISAETEFTVEFYDLDPMQVVWHGNYIKYFELARRALLDKIGYGYREMEDSGYAFPVIDVSAKFVGSLKFNDRARIKAVLEEYENRLRLKYEIRNAETGALTTKGISTQMAYDIKAGESCFVCPRALIQKVEAMIQAGAAR